MCPPPKVSAPKVQYQAPDPNAILDQQAPALAAALKGNDARQTRKLSLGTRAYGMNKGYSGSNVTVNPRERSTSQNTSETANLNL